MTSLIFWISASRLAMFSLYRLIALSVLLYSSWSTSFSEVTASSFSESALAVDSSCCRLVMRSSSSSLFLRRVCCSISFSRFSFFRFYRSSSSCASSRRHLAEVSFSAFCVIASWLFSDLYMFYAASRWLRIEWYSFQSCPASLRSFRQAACVLSCSSLALVIFAANSLRITLSCINKIINYRVWERRKGSFQDGVKWGFIWWMCGFHYNKMNGIYGRLWLISCATSTPAPQLINRFPIIKPNTAPFAHPSSKTSSSPPVPHSSFHR